MAHLTLHSPSHIWRTSAGIKAWGSSNPRHRTPFADGLHVLTCGEYSGMQVLDRDQMSGVDDGVDAVLGGVAERKEIIINTHGQSAEDDPQQEAAHIALSRAGGQRFFKELDPTTPAAKVALARGIVAVELDVQTGKILTKFVNNNWIAQVQADARRQLGGGQPFTVSGKSRVFALFAGDNRALNLPIRNMGIHAFIIEIVGSNPKSKLGHRDLRIATRLARDLIPTQCLTPLVISAHAITKDGPWTLQVRECDAGRVADALLLPSPPSDPEKYLKRDRLTPEERAMKPAALARIVEWQDAWDTKLQFSDRFTRLRAQAVHRSLREDGDAFCNECLHGQCSASRHALTPQKLFCPKCQKSALPALAYGHRPRHCFTCKTPV
jgi:hypothetical protein